MYINKMKEYRKERNITLKELSYMTGISVRIFVSFRKRNKKKSIDKSNGTYIKKTWRVCKWYFFWWNMSKWKNVIKKEWK